MRLSPAALAPHNDHRGDHHIGRREELAHLVIHEGDLNVSERGAAIRRDRPGEDERLDCQSRN